MNELNPIEQLTKTPEWIEVENIFKNNFYKCTPPDLLLVFS